MALPLHLFLVRHGESEGNIAQTQSREQADHSAYTGHFRSRHGSMYRLTPRGIMQARSAGAWLRAAGYETFDEAMVSDYIRAIETAGHLGLVGVSWRIVGSLRERDVGLMDQLPEDERQRCFPEHVRQAKCSPYFWTPPEGESIADTQVRLQAGFLASLQQGVPHRRVISVGHGRTIQALRALIEDMPFWEYELRERSHDPDHQVQNAHIFQYTRVNPSDHTHIVSQFGWIRSVCPWNETKTDPRWRAILSRGYDAKDLLKIADQFCPILTKELLE